jgi:hypothetical protein
MINYTRWIIPLYAMNTQVSDHVCRVDNCYSYAIHGDLCESCYESWQNMLVLYKHNHACVVCTKAVLIIRNKLISHSKILPTDVVKYMLTFVNITWWFECRGHIRPRRIKCFNCTLLIYGSNPKGDPLHPSQYISSFSISY